MGRHFFSTTIHMVIHHNAQETGINRKISISYKELAIPQGIARDINLVASVKMRKLRLPCLLIPIMTLSACSVITTTASVAGSVVGTTVDVATTAVGTTVDVVTSPVRD
jgi:hypothetical protein